MMLRRKASQFNIFTLPPEQQRCSPFPKKGCTALLFIPSFILRHIWLKVKRDSSIRNNIGAYSAGIRKEFSQAFSVFSGTA